MTKFLIDENVNQKGIRAVPVEGKGFDVAYPETNGYKGSADTSVLKLANAQQRVLVSTEKDFGEFHLTPEDVPHGAIWLRPDRISRGQIGNLLAGLCRTLTQQFPTNPYDFAGKIVEVFGDRVEIRTSGGGLSSFTVPPMIVN
jgi:predicted nuclease of predicted toxin-antitoxin system